LSAKFEFVIAESLSRYKFPGEICLYNAPEYVNLWDDFRNTTFLIVNSESHRIAASIHFQIKGNTAVSLNKAPFGSISLFNDVDFDTLSDFMYYIETHLISQGVRIIKVRHYPGIYHPHTYEKVISVLALSGFTVSMIDINQIIEITDDPFDSFIHPMELRKLNKAKKEGIIFTEHQNTEAKIVFNAIDTFRKAKNIPVNIEFDPLMMLMDLFPQNYKLFSVSLKNEMVAATVCVKVKDSILYNFLPAHNRSFNMYSPMVFLMEKIYQYSSQNKIKFIDLGVSSINNNPQKGLIRFKERLGGLTVSKLTFLKEI
jgi:hypothetical protein